jgi:4-amino-4-deoxy-L-arabinose transferase-like glycosyltransferase
MTAMNGAHSSRSLVDKTHVWPSLGLVMAVQVVCWTLAPMLTNDAPPLDVVENTVWGTERVIATYKNPALSSLLIEASRELTGAIGWPAYVLSQIAICFTYLFVFLLGRPTLGIERALVGTLLLTACYYFGWHTPEFNQDIVEMPLWAGVAFALWRAVETGRPAWWFGLGLFSAGALYGKLSAGILLASAALWLLTDARGRKSFRTAGPWIALGTFLAAIAPLALWLADGGLQIIADYAVRRGLNKFSALQFVGLQCIVVLPMFGVMWWAGLLRAPRIQPALDLREIERDWELQRFTHYLLWMTLAPILLTVVAVTVARTGTKLMWGVPMLNLTGLLAVALAGRDLGDFNKRALRRVLASSIALILATSIGMALTTRYGNQFRSVPDRQNWPQAEISKRMRQIWQNEVGRPLRIVAGDSTNWAAGLVALSNGEIAHVFTSANYKLSPWITSEQVARDGVLVVWPETETGASAQLINFLGGRAPRYETFALRHPGKARDVTLGYAIVPPGAAAAGTARRNGE